jgi:hypothetical protein
VCGIRRPRAIERVGDRFDDGGVDTDHTNWVDAIDVCEHHCIDFDAVAAQGNRIVVARAGRGTRQDARWIEPVRAARVSRLDVASYWHLYPSHTTPAPSGRAVGGVHSWRLGVAVHIRALG